MAVTIGPLDRAEPADVHPVLGVIGAILGPRRAFLMSSSLRELNLGRGPGSALARDELAQLEPCAVVTPKLAGPHVKRPLIAPNVQNDPSTAKEDASPKREFGPQRLHALRSTFDQSIK